MAIEYLLYYGRCVGARMLPTVSSLASEQAVPTSATMLRLDRLLGYAFPHPNGRKFYRASDMILRVLSDASYLSRPKAGSVRCRIPPFPRSSRRRRVPEPPHLQALNPHPRGLLLRGRGPNMPASMPRRGSPSMSGVFSPTWVIHSHQPDRCKAERPRPTNVPPYIYHHNYTVHQVVAYYILCRV